MSKPRLLFREQWISNWFDKGVDKPLKNLVGDTKQRYQLITFWSLIGFTGFGITTTSALFQILEILSCCKQEERKSCNQDFKAAPAWIIRSRQIESGPRDLSGLKCWSAAVNSICEKFTDIFTGSGIVALQMSDTF